MTPPVVRVEAVVAMTDAVSKEPTELAETDPLWKGQIRGRAKLIKTTDRDGNVVGFATHGQLLQGLVEQGSVIVGVKRPKIGECIDCGFPFVIAKVGKIGVRCKGCRTEHSHKKARENERKRRAANPEKARENERKRRAANPEKTREKVRRAKRKYCAANPEKEREKERKRYAANPERFRENERKRRAANPEKARENERKRYAANPEKARENARKYQEANPEKAREAKRKRYAANPEKEREKERKYREANLEKAREAKRKYRAKKRAQREPPPGEGPEGATE